MKVGAVFAELQAKTADFNSQMNKAGNTLDQFGSKGKRLEDQLKNLERQKQAVGRRLDDLTAKGKTTGADFDSLSNRSANLSDRINTQKMRMDELANSATKLPNGLEIAGKAFTKLGSLGANAMAGLFNSIKRVGEIALGNILANGFSTATTAITNFGKSAFGATAGLQDTRGGFEAMLGSAELAQKTLLELSDYNKKTPFQLPQLQEQAASLLAVGVSADNIIPTLDMLGKISRGNANRLSFLTLAYGQVQSATKLTGAELRQFTENGVPLLDLLAKQTGKSTAEMRADISDGAVSFEMVDKALKSTIQEGGRFYNYFERQSGNFSFVSSNILDEIGIVGRSIMGITETGDIVKGGIFEQISIQAQNLLGFIKENKRSIQDFGLALGGITLDVVSKLPKLFQDVKDAIQLVQTALNDLTNWYNANSSWILTLGVIVGSLATGFALVYGAVALFNGIMILATTIASIFGVVMAVITSPIFLIGLAIGALIAVGVLLYQNWDLIVSESIKLWNWLGQKVGEAGSYMTSKLNEFLTWLGAGWNMAISAMATPFIWFGQKFTEVVNYLSQGPQKVLSDIAYAIGFVFGTVLKTIIEGFTNTWNGIVFLWNNAGPFFSNLLNSVLAFFTSTFLNIGNFVGSVFETIKNIDYMGIGKAMIMGIILGVASMASYFWSLVLQMSGYIKDAFTTAFNFVVDKFNEIKKIDLMQVGKDIINGLIKGILDTAGKVGDTIKGMAEGITKGFKDAMGIHSPSKVFEMFGKYTAEGYQQGLEGQTVQTAQATAGMASASVAGAVSVNQSNAININGAQDTGAIMNQVKQFLATQNNLAFNGVL